jgi:hypothetical protein
MICGLLIHYLSYISFIPATPFGREYTDPCSSGYIGEFEIVDDHRSGKVVVQLNGRLNKTGVISPRFNVQVTQIENWVNLLLPSRGFGYIILVSVNYYSKCRSSYPFRRLDHLCRYPRP